METLKTLILTVLLGLAVPYSAVGQQPPRIGAQVWVAPEHSNAEIEEFFRKLSENGMRSARLFLMWNQLDPQPGEWDFRIYDAAFDAAEKYDVGIVATLMANSGPPHRGFAYTMQGGRIPKTREQLEESELYIEKVVKRYKEHPALDHWMLMNEPGQAPASDPLAISRFQSYLQAEYASIEQLNKQWHTAFENFEAIAYNPAWKRTPGFTAPSAYYDWHRFWQEHLTWYLKGVAEQIRKYDQQTPLHVNPHALPDIVHLYQLPKWPEFLNSLGASVHPVWHFGQFQRAQYPLGVAYSCDLVKGASAPEPFWVTELQGGHNHFSGGHGLRPTRKDLGQWLWTSIGSGAERIIYWSLNQRLHGNEAGEWALLDFQGQTTERTAVTKEIAGILEENRSFLKEAQSGRAAITLIVSPKTQLKQWKANAPDDNSSARGRYAHMEELLGFYETFNGLGIPVKVKHMEDFQWEQAREELVVLPHVSVLSDRDIERIGAFAEKASNKLLVTGLFGMYDEYENQRYLRQMPLEEQLGAQVREVGIFKEGETLGVLRGSVELPVHHFAGELRPKGGQAIAQKGERVLGVRHKSEGAEVVFLPSLVGAGAWFGENEPLSLWLRAEAAEYFAGIPAFPNYHDLAVTRWLRHGQKRWLVLSTSKEEGDVFKLPKGVETPRRIYGPEFQWKPDNRTIRLEAKETLVIAW